MAILLTGSASAADNGVFACYRVANEMNQSSALSFDGKFALNYRSDYAFDLLSAGKVANCDIAKVSSAHHGGPPYRVKILISGKSHYFLYSRDAAKEVKPKPEEAELFPAVDCKSTGGSNGTGIFQRAIENQLNQAQEICESADENGGMTASRTCYNRFEEALKTCQRAKQPGLKRYAGERLRALQAHVPFKDSRPVPAPDTSGPAESAK